MAGHGIFSEDNFDLDDDNDDDDDDDLVDDGNGDEFDDGYDNYLTYERASLLHSACL